MKWYIFLAAIIIQLVLIAEYVDYRVDYIIDTTIKNNCIDTTKLKG